MVLIVLNVFAVIIETVESVYQERLSGKGELTRKRTIIGAEVEQTESGGFQVTMSPGPHTHPQLDGDWLLWLDAGELDPRSRFSPLPRVSSRRLVEANPEKDC